EGRTAAAVTVAEAAPASDSAMLGGTNAARAKGSVQYTVYSDPACTNLYATAGTVTVTAGSVPGSQLKLLAPGTYYWQASYSGDAANEPAKSACGSEVETVGRPSASKSPAPTLPSGPLRGEGAGGDVLASTGERPPA